jgi:hypothetical protein
MDCCRLGAFPFWMPESFRGVLMRNRAFSCQHQNSLSKSSRESFPATARLGDGGVSDVSDSVPDASWGRGAAAQPEAWNTPQAKADLCRVLMMLTPLLQAISPVCCLKRPNGVHQVAFQRLSWCVPTNSCDPLRTRSCGSGTHRPGTCSITPFLVQSSSAAPPADFAIVPASCTHLRATRCDDQHSSTLWQRHSDTF